MKGGLSYPAMHNLRCPRPTNVEIRADDPALTGHAGLLLTGELAGRIDLVARLDRAIDALRPFKQRRRGRSGGELLVSLAEMMTAGGDHLVHLDELREDEAGAERRPTMHRLRLEIPTRAWRPALQMPQAEIAETTYARRAGGRSRCA